MKSSSLSKILFMNGIESARAYRDALIHEWHLPEQFAKQLLIYKLLYTDASSFVHKLEDGEVSIMGRSYSVTWMNPPSEIRKYANFLVLSLRYCSSLERGYVLVRCSENEPTNIEKVEWK